MYWKTHKDGHLSPLKKIKKESFAKESTGKKTTGEQEQKHKKHIHKGNYGTKESGLLQGEKLLGLNLSRFQNCKKRPKNAQQIRPG
jgi:hypothetical protein